MKILMQGNENKGAIAVLILLADITSEAKINAIYGYYVDGYAKQHCVNTFHVDQSNLNKAIALVEDAAKHIDNYNLLRIKRKVRSPA